MGDVIRRGSKDRPRFYVRYVDVDGVRRMKVARGATTKAQAQTILNAAELRVTQGKVGIEEPTPATPEEQLRATLTVRQLCEKFVAEYRSPRLKDPARYSREAKSIFKTRVWPELEHQVAGSVRLVDVERMRDKLAATDPPTAPASIVRALSALSKAYNWARRMGYVDCANPVAGVERPREQHSIDYLSKLEVAQLLEWTEKHAPALHVMVAAAIYTGLRKGELFGLRWRDVHIDAARLDVMRSYRLAPKSGKARHLPLHPELVRLLRTWTDRCPKTEEELVFPVLEGAGWCMGDRFESLGLGEALEAAGCHVPAKPWHALRHTFASHFMMAGGNILTLQKLLGHASVAMTMVYAHLAPDFMAGEVARMSFVVPRADVANLAEERRRRGYQKETPAHGNEKGAESAPSSSTISLVSPEGVEPSTNGLRGRPAREGA